MRPYSPPPPAQPNPTIPSIHRGLKSIPFSRCPPIKVARVESDNAVAWTEELLNNASKCVVFLGGM